MIQGYKALKTRQRKERDNYPINLSMRVHRALSWLNKASQCEDDLDSEFIFLWIAFNAAYADDFSAMNFSETGAFRKFINKLCHLDKQSKLNGLVWVEFPKSIRMLLNNQYVFNDFWVFHRGDIAEEEWLERFAISKQLANKALAGNNAADVLVIIFSRLFTLRNQLVHGGATWNGAVNRDQIRDGVNFMRELVPLIIELMMANPGELWGEPSYLFC